MIYFTGDQHFNHANIITYCNRPFKDVDEMNDTIIDNFNSTVTPSDEVYHIGDFAWYDGEKFLGRLNGTRHHLIIGNHDRKHVKSMIRGGWFLSVQNVVTVKYNHRHIWCSHYAHARWPSSHSGRFHVFGHSHGMFDGIGRSMDVGVDALGFYPISFDDVVERLSKKGVIGAVEKCC